MATVLGFVVAHAVLQIGLVGMETTIPGRKLAAGMVVSMARQSSKTTNSSDSVGGKSMLLLGVGLTHIRAQKCASPHGGRHVRELHISAGITHHPNLNPEGDFGFCWSLPETSKLNETSRTPVFSARTAAILMRH